MTDVAPSGDARPPVGSKTQLRVGRLVKAHGLKGALKLELYTDDPDGRFVPGATFTLQVPESSPWHGKPLTVREFRWMNSHPVDEEDAWYDHQLVGLDVVRDGAVVGRVARVDHLPSQDLLAVLLADETEVLVPFVKAIVPEVDLAAGRVRITPPAGLFEELPPEADEALGGEVPEARTEQE